MFEKGLTAAREGHYEYAPIAFPVSYIAGQGFFFELFPVDEGGLVAMSGELAGKEKFQVKGFIIPMKRFPHIDESQSLQEAVKALRGYTCGPNERMRYSELLVISEQHQLVGRVNLQSILKGLDPNLAQVFKGYEGTAG